MWEEPPISGSRGSGTIFFSGCSLGCVFCQNNEISRGNIGKSITTQRLAEIMLELEAKGAHNINFVTPTHYAPSVAEAVETARASGLSLPIIYNTGSYETPQTLKILDGYVDIYLPDFKFYKNSTARKYTGVNNYIETAKAAIAQMFGQVGLPHFSDDGMLKSGVVARILLLPGHLAEAKLSLKYLYDTYGDDIYISLMNQYTPMPNMESPLNRRVTHAEYEELCDYAVRIGLKNGYIQEYGTAKESFIPPFNFDGI